ncbi:MAG: peptide ABC transporter substrate-binding protein [Chloroflexi bacterium]|nr:peptide ABC transporter substrate-binding protein [Chloroflexota bacterium]
MFTDKKCMTLIALVAMIATILAACAPPATPEVIVKEVPVEKKVVETVVVEKEVPVEKEVVKEVPKEVIKEVVVTPTPVPPPPKKKLEGLWYPIGTEPPTLDIQLATDTTSHLIIHQCIEGLFEYRGDGSIEPTGATAYEVSDDGLIYTITLRKEAVWSDGVPVIAQHYVDGVIRLLKPETAAEYAWLMYDIEGAEEFNIGETDDPALVGVKALDDYTLEVKLKAPTPYFETVLPFSTFYPVRLDIVEKYGDKWTEPGNYVSNGAYLLDYWEHEAEVGLVKNPTYWGAANVKIEKITIPIIRESATALALYENDELHASGEAGFPSEEIPRITTDPVLSKELRILPRPGVYYIGLNTLREPTDNLLVRKALASAIDRVSININVVQRPWQTALCCTTPPKILGYQECGTCGYDFDPKKAQAYLAEAGYPDGEGFPVLSFWFNRADYNEDVIEAVAAMWEKHLGISVELRTNEWAVYLDYLDQCNNTKEDLAACEFNAYRMGWVMDYGDPQNQLEVVFAPRSTFQYTGWENARFDELMDLARSEFDTDKREAYYMEADKILCEDEVSIIPIHGYERNTLVRTGVKFEYPPFGAPNFAYWALP